MFLVAALVLFGAATIGWRVARRARLEALAETQRAQSPREHGLPSAWCVPRGRFHCRKPACCAASRVRAPRMSRGDVVRKRRAIDDAYAHT
ncbi:MAG TPA: hypothetical protein VM619_15025 [Luteimonas sp.]|nr:hypothetical protein [Luteimonas sp.]